MFTRKGSKQGSDLGGVHDDGGDEVEEDVVAVGADTRVAEGHFQLIHGLQEQPLALVLQVFKRGFLSQREGRGSATSERERKDPQSRKEEASQCYKEPGRSLVKMPAFGLS